VKVIKTGQKNTTGQNRWISPLIGGYWTSAAGLHLVVVGESNKVMKDGGNSLLIENSVLNWIKPTT